MFYSERGNPSSISQRIVIFANWAQRFEISINHTSHVIQHIVITKLITRDLLLRQQEQLLFTPKAGAISCYSAVGGWRGLESWSSTNGWVSFKKNLNFIYHLCICACVCTFSMCMCWLPLPVYACVFTSPPGCTACQQKCWISVSCASLPDPKEPPDTWAFRQSGHRDSSDATT